MDARDDLIRLSTFTVDVLLNSGPGRFLDFDPDHAALSKGVTLEIVAASAAAVCELMFAIGNSHPTEMFAPQRCLAQVRAYRAAGLRSLSVGDVLVIHTPDGPIAHACQDVGWQALPAMPDVPEPVPCGQCGRTVPGTVPSHDHDRRCPQHPRNVHPA